MLSPKKKKQKDLVKKLSDRYRVIVLKGASFEEKFSTTVSPIKVLFLFSVLFVFFGVFFWFLYAHTPIKYSVPGYPHEQIIHADIENKYQADSILQLAQMNSVYFNNLKAILRGEEINDLNQGLDSALAKDTELDFELTEVDSLARIQVEEENQLDIDDSNISTEKNFLEEVLLHKPAEGVISDGVNIDKGHYGIDVSSAEGTRVKSILAGTVIFSGFTADGGNEIHIQHDFNLISIYKHNSAVLKSAGDKVISGESVAIVGNSGEHSDGTHLHFEMWQKGTMLNPEDYFSY